jgi:hypothetical protein
MFPSSKWKKTKTKNESKSNWWAPIWHFISSVFHRSFSKSYIQNSERVVCETRLLVRVYLLLELEQQTGTRQYAVDLYTKVLHDFVYYPMDTRRSRYKLIFFLSVTKENNERPSNKWNRRNKKCSNYWYTDQIVSLIFAKSVSDSSDLTELRDSVSKLWKALRELESEVRESFDIHAAIENHEHQVKLQNCF